MDNIPYLLALHSVDGLGPIRLKSIISHFGDPKAAWKADPKTFHNLGIPQPTIDKLIQIRKILDPELFAKSILESGIKWVTSFDGSYPKLLKEIYDPPMVLYYRGEILPQDEKAIAIVGSRKMTGYGKVVTEEFSQTLAVAGVTVVSGLARGVDTTAHLSAIKSQGRTLAILGGGLNHIFPPENVNLARQIAGGFGAVISEFPPDYPSVSGNFPARNRIISGLSKAVVVTEAAEDSGSLITARLALEQGRDVFAIPGPVTSSLSKGPIDLIKEGARPVSSATEILEELGMSGGSNGEKPMDYQLTKEEAGVLQTLERESLHIDQICRSLNLPAAKISATLLKLEISGLVKNLGSGIYCKS